MEAITKSKWDRPAYLLVIMLLIAFSIATLFPFLWMISTSLRTDVDLFKNPMNWIPSSLYLNNYQEVWTAIPFGQYFLNTFKLTVIITVLQVIICSMAAYAFAKLKVPFKKTVFLLFMTNLMMPWHSIMVPQFSVVSELGLYNTHTGYVLIQLFSGFGIFLMRQFFMSLPNELNEAARVDGYSEWQIFWRIAMPLSAPSLSTFAIFTFTFMWNDYLAPLIYLNDDSLKTLQLGLKAFQTEHTMDYGLLMAGTVLATIPMIVVFLLGERFFIQSVATTGMKN
ncbi:multiple sugar transport system permease protein [Paenibacillus phyllosphaerae]|uniref:Multiple sugar transport system permease protein n=1 Tax=Paenibacillus phyllosphaerae TaxID=274593 RepID=A0A7W5FNU4_9BACL|nr:carbohydrate ABC transporter permease [Paenibacillus phyllosphaerae]MBB3111522.1 multiple sugar transport system permease protein [Paenibacillus phyllosphaerae]